MSTFKFRRMAVRQSFNHFSARKRQLLTIGATALVGCVSGPERSATTEPVASANTSIEKKGESDSTSVGCDMFVLTPNGKYRTKSFVYRVQRSGAAAATSARNVRLMYTDWAFDEPNPRKIATCVTSDEQSSVVWFEGIFGKSERVEGAIKHLDRTAADERFAGSVFEALKRGAQTAIMHSQAYVPPRSAMCDQTDPFGNCCDNVDECPGWGTAGEWDGPPPSGSSQPSASVPSDPTVSDICTGRTDYIHLSTTPGYFGRVSVHGRTTCEAEHSVSVLVVLKRQRCFFILCWNELRGTPGVNTYYGIYADAEANANCQTGYWRADSFHLVIWDPGHAGTASSFWQSRISFCPYG